MKAILCTRDCEVCFEKFHEGEFMTEAFANFLISGKTYTIASFLTIANGMNNNLADKTIKILEMLGNKNCFRDIKILY